MAWERDGESDLQKLARGVEQLLQLATAAETERLKRTAENLYRLQQRLSTLRMDSEEPK